MKNIDNINSENIIKKALKKIRELNTENELLRQQIIPNEPIAIIGMSCRFPNNINTTHQFWNLLSNKGDVIKNHFRPEFLLTNKAQFGGFIDNPYEFAVNFFNISRRELKSIDPQQRLLLELTWEVFENAAIKPSELAAKNVGVFVGIIADDYSQLMLKYAPDSIGSHFAAGNAHSTAAGRISHWFDFKGPCLAIDTACSSSLVALHLACKSLLQGECQAAVVASANCLLTDIYHHNFSQAGMLAADGYCKVFDEIADGYVRSEGCAALLLKTFSQAQADGDEIWGLVKGSAINHDGHCSALTVPNKLQQIAVIEAALASAGISFNDLQYVEAHGSGTSLGDPIELQALGDLCQQHNRLTPLYLGAGKANLGHLEATAGLVGLIKTVLCLKKQSIPPQILFKTPTTRFDWQKYPIIISTEQQHITGNENGRLFAGVSSFGFSGTNAHVILENYNSSVNTPNSQLALPFILCLSAKNWSELLEQIEQFLPIIQSLQSDQDAYNVCFTANIGREFLNNAVILVASTLHKLNSLLIAFFNASKQSLQPEHNEKEIVVDYQLVNDVLMPFEKKLLTYYPELPNWEFLISNTVDWNQYYHFAFPKKIRLPNYPYNREYIVFDQLLNAEIETVKSDSLGSILYETVWEKVNPDLTESLEISIYDDWNIISLETNISENLLASLREKISQSISVRTIEQLQNLEAKNNSHILNVLVYYQQKRHQQIDPNQTIDLIDKLISIIKCCYRLNREIGLWLCLDYNSLKPSLEIAGITGAYKSIVLEFPAIIKGCIHFSSEITPNLPLAKLLTLAKKELVLRIEDNAYKALRLKAFSVSSDNLEFSRALTNQHVYVVTGGTGGIAINLIPWLIKQGVNKIALLSRQQPNLDFTHWINSQTNIEIKHFQVDISDPVNLFATLDHIKQCLGPIKGVFHAAGIADYRSGLELDKEHIQQTFMPKLTGAINIQAYFKKRQLDFIIYFGSVASVWGAAKMIPYSAVNACLEYLVNNSTNQYIIHYGPWENTGMANRLSDTQKHESGIFPLSIDSGLQALHLSTLKHSIIAANIDWNKFERLFHFHRKTNFLTGISIPHAVINNQEYIHHQKTIDVAVIKNIIATIISCSVEEVNPSQPLQEMGLDSIMILEFIQKLQPYTSKKLDDTLVFTYPTIETIINYLNDQPKKNDKRNSTIEILKEPIAIIGVSCRVGSCRTPQDFWNCIIKGENLVSGNIIEELKKRSGQFNPIEEVYAGNLLKDVYLFDAIKFRISPREARLIDPQQRIMLTLAHEAFESAGYNITSLTGSNCGVFIGVGNNEYANLCRTYMDSSDEVLFPTSQANNIIAGRISYFYGLEGSSSVIDTACSSSLLAIHQACQSLHLGEISTALAGGINLIFSLAGMKSLMQANMLSTNGSCRPFDNAANGYVRAEGAGLVLLKPLSRALKEKDLILGIIQSSAVNQDGQSASLTAPSANAQQVVMEKALARSTYASSEIHFIEAHGTGTNLGDPIELKSISSVYGENRQNSGPLFVNSIKSQIGHAEAASGILSLIRALGSVQTGLIPKQNGFQQLNEHVKELRGIAIPDKIHDLSAQQNIKGAISNFGFSGTNVHLILSGEVRTNNLFGLPVQPSKSESNYNIVPEILQCPDSNKDLLKSDHYKLEDDFYSIDWELSLLSQTQQKTSVFSNHAFSKTMEMTKVTGEMTTPLLIDYETYSQKLNLYCLISFVNAMKQLGVEISPSTSALDILSPIVSKHHSYAKLLFEHSQTIPLFYSNLHQQQLLNEETCSISPIKHEFKLIQSISEQMIQILSGTINSLDILFPSGNSALVNAIYQESPESKFMNAILTEAIKNLIIQAQVNSGEKVKILEVGAGTGGTTTEVLRMLDRFNMNYEYTYTDNSLSLLNDAKSKFSQNKNINYELFDLDNLIDFDVKFYQQYDLVIAANVLHVTKQIEHSAALLNFTLKTNGVLIILEGIKSVVWIDYIFGLTPGWWAFNDNRGKHPLLSLSQWNDILSNEGYQVGIVNPERSSQQAIVLGLKIKSSVKIPRPNLLLVTNDPEFSQSFLLEAESLGFTVNSLLHDEQDYNYIEKKYANYFNMIENDNLEIKCIYYYWNVESQVSNETIIPWTLGELIKYKQNSIYSKVPIYIITKLGIVDSKVDHQFIMPRSAMLWGVSAVARTEYPNLKLINIDFDKILISTLLREIYYNDDSHILYRNNSRYLGFLSGYERDYIPETENMQNSGWILSGGLGGIGQLIIQWLAQRGTKYIILLNRNPVSENITQHLCRLEHMYSTKIQHFQVDISDKEAIYRLINQIQQQKEYQISGIMHLAGVVQDKRIIDIKPDDFDKVFQAKIYGTKNLIEMGIKLGVSNFIAFSTITAILGNVGQINHAAANAYMDAYLYQHKHHFRFIKTINWGPWSEVGAAANDVLMQVERAGISPYDNSEGLRIFEKALSMNSFQIIPIKIKWHQFQMMRNPLSFYKHFWIHSNYEPLINNENKYFDAGSLTFDKVKQAIKLVFSESLSISTKHLDDYTGFTNFGVDSLMAISLAHKLSQYFKVPLDSIILFDYPTFDDLTNYLIELLIPRKDNSLLKSITKMKLQNLINQKIDTV